MPRIERGFGIDFLRGGHPLILPSDTPLTATQRGRQGVLIGGTTQHPRDQLRRGFVFRFRTDYRGDLDRIPRLWHSCNTGKAQKVSPVTEVDNNQALESEVVGVAVMTQMQVT